MGSKFRIIFVILFLMGLLPVVPATAAPPDDFCLPDGVQPSGAIYRFCVPPNWNGDLVVFAHGYMAPDSPLAIPEDQLRTSDGTYLPNLVNILGYAFATTSYHKNGLAVVEGISDLREMVSIFKGQFPQTQRVFLTGPSEGGLITTLSVEQFPSEYVGGFALCGPVGDFARHVNYLGDFRVVFDYFFPGVLPGSPIDIPQQVKDNWETVYTPLVIQAVTANPEAALQLIRVTKAPIDPNDVNSVGATILGLLWYNVFATKDAAQTLGGQPFDNWTRVYHGSLNDARLNQQVARFSADPAALNELNLHYQTTGQVQVPLVMMHTNLDPIVPFWHEPLYRAKVIAAGSTPYYNMIPVQRYGHCAFTAEEVVRGFNLLVLKVTAQSIPGLKLPLAFESAFPIYLPALLNNSR